MNNISVGNNLLSNCMNSKSGSKWDYRYLLLPGIERRVGCSDAP